MLLQKNRCDRRFSTVNRNVDEKSNAIRSNNQLGDRFSPIFRRFARCVLRVHVYCSENLRGPIFETFYPSVEKRVVKLVLCTQSQN